MIILQPLHSHHLLSPISKLVYCSLYSLITRGRLFLSTLASLFQTCPSPCRAPPQESIRYIQSGINKGFSFLLSALGCCQNPEVSPGAGNSSHTRHLLKFTKMKLVLHLLRGESRTGHEIYKGWESWGCPHFS